MNIVRRINKVPATYTHYRMGKDVINALPGDIRGRIAENRDIFDIGLQGPDIFFYYLPVLPNRINTIGYGMHRTSPESFLRHAKAVLAGMDSAAERSAGHAYLCGFICHYVLDTCCHRYIRSRKGGSGEHSQLETALERLLLEADGLDPFTKKAACGIYPAPGICSTISRFYKGVTARRVRKALYGQIFYRGMMSTKGTLPRALINVLFLFTGNFPYMHGLLMTRKNGVPECRCRDLLRIYTKSVRVAARMIEDYTDYLCGRSPIRGFNGTFSGKNHI